MHLDEVKRCIAALKAGTFNEDVRENLPAKHRTGYITRKDLWDIFPESREDFFKDFPKEDARTFQIHRITRKNTANVRWEDFFH